MRRTFLRLAALAACLCGALMPAAADAPRTIIVMDGSGSMWGQIDGRPKLEIARKMVAKALGGIPRDRELGLLAYGHREKGQCSDIELIVPPAAGTAPAILDAVNTMRFLGKTPLSEAVRQAADALRFTEEAATVVLVTDGLETCNADPCALGAELEAAGLDFTAHVIGFGLTKAEGAQVACLAGNTGGRYFDAGDADGLADALLETVAADEPAPATPPVQRTYFPGAPVMPGIALAPTGQTTGAPESALAAFDFPSNGTAQQCAAICTSDAQCAAWRYEPAGSLFVAEARCFTYGASSEMDYNAYDLSEGWSSGIKDGVLMLVRPYIAQEPLPEATLDAPDTAPAGQVAQIAWTGPATELDAIEIGLSGDGERWTYVYVADGNPAALLMPGEPGEYELRYKFRDQFVIATRPIAVTEATVSMTAPDRVLASSDVSVAWVGPDADYDNIQLAVPGSDGYLTYVYVRDNNPVVLTMPDEPGLYELRYKLADREVIATRPIEVLPADVVVPEDQDGLALVEATFQADTGGLELAISWSATPLPGQDLPPEAWAMQEAVIGPVTERFLPGAYDVLGEAGDDIFAGRVDITARGPNVFTIPRSGLLSPGGEDRPDEQAHLCPGPRPCAIADPSGLAFTLPAGWSSDAPFLYETAGGVKADRPTVTFLGPNGNPVLLLNPIRWLESNGVCTESAAGPLCIPGLPESAALAALAVILPSLAYSPAGGDGGIRFGGTPFIPPAGGDPLKTIVPGWRKQ